MIEALWLLLPVAAASGWWAAKREHSARHGGPGGNADYFKGLNYLLDDKPDQAIEVFMRMTTVDRDTAETHLALGNLFRRRGEVDRAIRIHRDLIARDTLTVQQRSRALLELGEDYLRAGLFDRAETLFREIVTHSEHTTVALIRLVDIYVQEKDWRQAIACCERLEPLTGQPRRIEVAQFWCELAEQALARRERAEARACLQQALSRDGDCARASILSGQMAMAEGDFPAAIAAFQAVQRQDRDYFSEVITPLRQSFAALGEETRLIDYLRDVQRQDHSGHVTAALADLLLQQEGREAALHFLETELREYPTVLGMRRLIELKLTDIGGNGSSEFETLYRIGRHLLRDTPRYKCGNCGFEGKRLHWRCPGCKRWNSVRPRADALCAGGA